MTERDAQEKGLRYRVARMPMAWVARALEAGETRGMMIILVAADTEQILGAAVLGMLAQNHGEQGVIQDQRGPCRCGSPLRRKRLLTRQYQRVTTLRAMAPIHHKIVSAG